MGKRRRQRPKVVLAGVGILGVTCAIVVAIGSAGAAPAKKGRHCAANVSNGEEKCFNTLAQAQAYANQKIKDNGAGAQASVKEPSDVVIGTLFTDRRYGGSSITLWGSRPCKNDDKADFYFNLPKKWNHKVSSVQGWARCDIVLHSHPYLEGVESPVLKDLTPVISGQWDNLAESIEFR